VQRPSLPGSLDPHRDRLMRRPEVERATGLSRSSLYRLIAEGKFPSSIRLSEKSVAWLASEVDGWIAERVAASRNRTRAPAQIPSAAIEP
jgi:prophage regulatory protein